MTTAEVITSISVAISAIAFVLGVNAWRREHIGKKRIELAEKILAHYYEASDAIHEIRNPFSYAGEGSTRQRSKNETEEESEILDKAYVIFERYKKRDKFFSELLSMKYQAMAVFGSDIKEPFDEISKILNEIFGAARILGSYYWQRQGRVNMDNERFKNHQERMEYYESKFWYQGEEDEITKRLNGAIEKIETITKDEVSVRERKFIICF